jgi:hypothetical protein
MLFLKFLWGPSWSWSYGSWIYDYKCGSSWDRVPSGQTKDYNIGICFFSAKNAALSRKSKDWLFQMNQNDVSEWSDMSIRWLWFQWASTIKIQLSMLILYKADIIISMEINTLEKIG